MSGVKSVDDNKIYDEGVIAPETSRHDRLRRMENDGVQFLRLIFTDILGVSKNVEVPASQFEKAQRGEIMFDGSSIEEFSRIEESDMLLVPGSEARVPDPSCNPYLAFLVLLHAGLDGIRNKIDPGPAVNLNIFDLDENEKSKHNIRQLSGDLNSALDEQERDEILCAALGEHIVERFLAAKRQVWREFSLQVYDWELERYLAAY